MRNPYQKIFEVLPYAEHKQEYLGIAAALAPRLKDMDGFISTERFQSLQGDFQDYRIRIAGVIRDYGLNQREFGRLG